ncbi:MAG: UDP-glucose/GDP-mannose dehydrogenase family protein [Gammaproteobacteria bacterium]|nr:UDP-glucose/GDP-mannose dehydrogenase family protein [Gammaproteobacteria bacterium]
MNITIVGTGYVGLVTGTCLAEVGNHVVCVDSDQAKIDGLNNGEIPIHEPGLDEMVGENVEADRLSFTTDIREGVAHGEIIFIAVGTPPDEDGGADLRHVLAVADAVGRHIQEYRVVVTKSTVPVGTADKVRAALEAAIRERGLEPDFSVVSNPEFLKEGAAIEDFMKPDRIVVGADDPRAVERMRELYAPFNRSHDRMIVMDVPSAELTKYAANSLLATKISFMNEMANLAELLGADIESVRQGIGSDHRIGYHFIYPGCGYGGSCFPKDVQALQRTASEKGYDARILNAVERVNNNQKFVLLSKMDEYFGAGNMDGARIALWGLSFKPNTDDMREAPSRVIMEGLWERGVSVAAFDPVAADETRRIYGDRAELVLAGDPYEALEGADALVIVTEWKIFRSPDMNMIKQRMKRPLIFDGRNIFDPEQMRRHGIEYRGIGRSNHA